MTTQALIDEACNEKKFKKTIKNILGVSSLLNHYTSGLANW